MRVVQATEQIPEIGFQTENNRTQVRFPLADIMDEFPGGLATLIIQRPGEKTKSISTTTEMDGTDLVWTVDSWSVEKRGLLLAQVVYAVTDVVAKTKIYRFHVSESLLNAEPAPPDWEDWMNNLIAAAAGVNSAINGAMSTLNERVSTATAEALKAEGYAAGTQDGEPVEEDSPYYEHNAEYHAGQAASSETVAREKADEVGVNTLKTEGWALGKQNGQDVQPGSPYYHANAKYYEKQAGDSAAGADASAQHAEQMAKDAALAEAAVTQKASEVEDATSAAIGASQQAFNYAFISEGYAAGSQNGVPAGPGSPYYRNSSKYYQEQAQANAATAGEYADFARQYVSVMTATASSLGPDETPTAVIDRSVATPVLRLGLPRGKSGVYVGTTAPTEPDYNIWIDPSGTTNISAATGVSF